MQFLLFGKVASSQKWPSTYGQVTSIEERVNHKRSSDTAHSIDHIVDATYSYKVNGHSIEGTKIHAGFPNVYSYDKGQKNS